MKAESEPDELRDEYEFTVDELRAAERGRYARRHPAGTRLVPLDPDVAEVFPDAASVNDALRALAGIIKQRSRPAA
jgi:hypothetical protein